MHPTIRGDSEPSRSVDCRDKPGNDDFFVGADAVGEGCYAAFTDLSGFR